MVKLYMCVDSKRISLKNFLIVLVGVILTIILIIMNVEFPDNKYLNINYSIELTNNCLADPPNCKDFTGIDLVSVKPINLFKNSIFYLEVHGHDFISPRILCSVESAARTNPQKFVFLLTTSPKIYKTPALTEVIDGNENIYFGYLDHQLEFAGSPLNEWYKNKRWSESKWPGHHISNVLRLMLLWKYGGIYLDTDVILIRKLPHLYTSYVAFESEDSIGTAVLALPPKHQILTYCMHEIATTNYDPNLWSVIGPILLTNSLQQICGKDILKKKKNVTCLGVNILGTKSFYPIHWSNWKQYYETTNKSYLFNDPNIYGFHFWNSKSRHEMINLNKMTPFAIAASNFCPTVVKIVKDKM